METPPSPGQGGAEPVIILVRPQLAENIGMAARAMGNFGLSRLRLVAPREGWPQKKKLKKGAVQAASGASDILAAAEVFDSVEAAIGELSRVYATTARSRDMAKRVSVPDEAAQEIVAAGARGEATGILFGPERTGLENDEVGLADAILTFPVNPAFSSLNLAQAVLLVGYEWFKAAHGNRPAFEPAPEAPPARRETLLAFFDYLETALDAANHWGHADKRPTMVRNLRNVFLRQPMSEQDVRTLRGAIRALLRHGERLGAEVGPAADEGIER